MEALRLKTVMKQTTLRRTKLLKMIDKEEFPAPFFLSARIKVWDSTEIDKYLKKKKEGLVWSKDSARKYVVD